MSGLPLRVSEVEREPSRASRGEGKIEGSAARVAAAAARAIRKSQGDARARASAAAARP